MRSGRNSLNFQRNTLFYLEHVSNTFFPNVRKFTPLHGVVHQKTVIFIVAVLKPYTMLGHIYSLYATALYGHFDGAISLNMHAKNPGIY
jgi:hypothetical protein